MFPGTVPAAWQPNSHSNDPSENMWMDSSTSPQLGGGPSRSLVISCFISCFPKFGEQKIIIDYCSCFPKNWGRQLSSWLSPLVLISVSLNDHNLAAGEPWRSAAKGHGPVRIEGLPRGESTHVTEAHSGEDGQNLGVDSDLPHCLMLSGSW